MSEHCLPYSEMEESGVQWLGTIPAHWEIIQSRRLFDQRKERMRQGDKQLTVSQKYGVIPQSEFMRLEEQKVMQVFIGADILKHVEPNDFVISMRSFQGGIEWCGYAGCVSSAYVGITPVKHVVPGYFKYLFKSNAYIQALQSTSNLVRDGQALRFQNFANVSLPVVSEEEQTQIAKFLDYETTKIDALIEKQQQLIALLKEKRQAVIRHAVTKGLNPDAPMRDSGVEWLGEAPAHWVTVKLGYRYEILLGKMLDTSKVSGAHLGRYLRNTDVQWDRINEEGLPEMDFWPHEHERYSVRTGDLLVCEGGEIGRCAIWPNDYSCFYQKALHRLRPKRSGKDVTRFMYYHLSLAVAQQRFTASAEKATIAHLPAETFRQCRFTFPPHEEQQAIAGTLDVQSEKFDAIEKKAQEQIELLQERRTALISAAVTGKIDVRSWKPPASETEAELP